MWVHNRNVRKETLNALLPTTMVTIENIMKLIVKMIWSPLEMPLVFAHRRAMDTVGIITLSQRSRHHQMFILWNISTMRPPVSSSVFWHDGLRLAGLFYLRMSRRPIIRCVPANNKRVARCCNLARRLTRQRSGMGHVSVFFIILVPDRHTHRCTSGKSW